jgi:hypothetical protein
MGFFSRLFSNWQSRAPSRDKIAPCPATAPVPGLTTPLPCEARMDWRTSEGHQRILLCFTYPSTPEIVPRWVDWDGLLGESISSAIQKLKAEGALLPADEPAPRILHSRGANELRKMCRERGLKVSGTKEQMAERLAGIDPSGLVPGSSGEMLKCSPDAERVANAGREAWELCRGDARELAHIFDQQELEAERQKLRQQFLRKGLPGPSEDDVKWGMLNRRALQHASEGNLGLCRNMYLVMAGFLAQRKRLKDDLRLHLMVCAYDLNGTQNRGGTSIEMLRQFPMFDPAAATLAPAVVEDVQSLAEELKLSLEDVRTMYLESAEPRDFPLAPGRTWSALSLAIEGKIDLDDQPRCFERIRSLLA